MNLNVAIEKDFREWLDFLNEIRKIGVDEDFGIPQIAVIGDQSSGKSSLLNSLTGIPFPRGTGLVTRCPTVIAMQQVVGSKWHAEVSLVSSMKGNAHVNGTGPVSSPEELAGMISTLTDYLTKSSVSGFSRDSIFVKVEAADIPNLIIVDLPGIIRTTTVGQNHTVISEVDELLDHFMLQPRTIILAVVPANQDIATVDVLERALRVDPLGARTIGVLTKPDLVDDGAEDEVLAVVNNMRKPLSLGYVIVKNRSQAQLKANLSLADALAAEDQFFLQHPRWQTIHKASRGIDALSMKLTHCLVAQAKAALPFMKWELNQKIVMMEKDLRLLGPEIPGNDLEKSNILMQLVFKFGQIIRRVSMGDYRDDAAQINPELRIKYHVSEITRQLQININLKVPDFDSDSYSSMLAATLASMRGRELPGFMSASLLMGSVSVDLESWRVEIENAISKVMEVYLNTAKQLAFKLAEKFPRVQEVLMKTVEGCCVSLEAEMSARALEMFERGAGGTLNDKEMVESINEIRCDGFDKTLKEALSGARKMTTDTADKCDLKNQLKRYLGRTYMEQHAVGKGPGSQIGDAKAALKAYWRISEARLLNDVVSLIDMVLLQRGSELIEQNILSEAQSWTKTEVLSVLLAEDPAESTRRTELREKKIRVDLALQKIVELSPGCIARDPSTMTGATSSYSNNNNSNSNSNVNTTQTNNSAQRSINSNNNTNNPPSHHFIEPLQEYKKKHSRN
jgi:interferon-induced GTP-binding protein Mx1